MGKKITIAIALIMIAGSLLLIKNGSDATVMRMRTHLSRADASFWGEDASDNSGYSVAGAWDVNGDGYDDILIGAYNDEDGGSYSGQTYLILGKESGWVMDKDLSEASASFWGEDANDQSGCCVAGAGDVNGDGYDDILIGAYGDDDGGSNAGQTYLIFGKAAGWAMDTDLSLSSASFRGEDSNDESGSSVAGAGDVNGDGFDDILIGAKGDEDGGGTNAGQTYLILGKASGWSMDTDLSGSSASFWGEDSGDYSAYSVSGAGDVNGDGYDDILIGAEGDDDMGTEAGQTYLILGKASGWAMDTDLSASSASFRGESSFDFAGCSVDGAGDVNGDGYDDILIGAVQNDEGGSWAGQTYLVLGKASGWAMDTFLSGAAASFIGEDSNDQSGYSVAGAGDVDQDGYDDFLIGGFGDEDGGSMAGQTYVILGHATGWTKDTYLSSASGSFIGENPDDFSGSRVAGAGDVNGDGYDDIFIGAPYDDDGGSAAGQTYLVLSGVDPPGPRNLRYSLSSSVTMVTLNWDAPNSWAEPLEAYRIYRSANGMDYQYLGFTSTSTRTYSDNTVSIGVTYHYMVVADYNEGWETSGKAYMSVVCDLDTDGDGVGNLADIDDDDDGYPDHSDAFPLDKTEWMDSDWDGEGNEADKDDDNDGIGDTDDAEPLNPLNGVKLDLATMHTDLIESRDEITLMLEGIGFDLENINDTLIERIDDLDLKISAQLYQLRALIESVNASVQTRLSRLDTDLTAFRSDMDAGLSGITASLDADQAELIAELGSISDMIGSLSISLEGMNASMLDSIVSGLTGVSKELSEGDDNLSTEIGILLGRLNEYRDDTAHDLQNISDLMATMQELESLSQTADRIETDLDALNGLQTGVDDIQKEQEDTGSDITLNTVLLIAAIFLQVLLLIIGAVLLMRRRERSEGFRPE